MKERTAVDAIALDAPHNNHKYPLNAKIVQKVMKSSMENGIFRTIFVISVMPLH